MGVTEQGTQGGDGMEPYDGDDEESAAVLRTIGRVVKSCREQKGLTQAELGTAIGYSEEQVSSVERGGGRRVRCSWRRPTGCWGPVG